jgi:hypothetical protein
MLRVAIRATTETDVDAETENLRRAARGAGLEAGLIDRLVDEALTVVRDFVNRGRELKAIGSHFQAERTIQGDGYDIRVSFDTAQPSSLVRRVLAAFRR